MICVQNSHISNLLDDDENIGTYIGNKRTKNKINLLQKGELLVQQNKKVKKKKTNGKKRQYE